MIFLIRIFLVIAAWKAIPLDSPSSSVHIIYGRRAQGSSQHSLTSIHIPPELLTQISFSRCPFALIPSVHLPSLKLPNKCHTSPWELILQSNTSDCRFLLHSAWFCLKPTSCSPHSFTPKPNHSLFSLVFAHIKFLTTVIS